MSSEVRETRAWKDVTLCDGGDALAGGAGALVLIFLFVCLAFLTILCFMAIRLRSCVWIPVSWKKGIKAVRPTMRSW